jgi:hypothetical protein
VLLVWIWFKYTWMWWIIVNKIKRNYMCVDGSTSAKSRDVKSLDENEKLMYIKSDWRFKMLIWIEKIHGPLWKSIQPNENLRRGIGSYCILLVNGSKIAKKLVCDELWWNTKENSMIMDLFIFLVNKKKRHETWIVLINECCRTRTSRRP